MIEVKIKDSVLRDAASQGDEAFVKAFLTAIHEAIDGELTDENIRELTSDQVTLLIWEAMREELLQGGFIQLIHNGWGGYIFHSPFDKAVRAWGMQDLCSLIRKAHKLYTPFHADIEADCTDDEFMALYEHYPQFDELDDYYIENDDRLTKDVAHYVDEHIGIFATVIQ